MIFFLYNGEGKNRWMHGNFFFLIINEYFKAYGNELRI